MADLVQQYQQFASDFTGSIATLQQETCADFVPDELPVQELCLTCTPNPDALVPDWTTRDANNPFLNQQTCQYSITITTEYTDVGGEALQNRINEYAPFAVRKLLRYFNKLETDEVVNLLVNGYAGSGPVIQGIDWYIPFFDGAKLKILYVIPAFNFDGLAADTEDPNAYGTEPEPSYTEVDLDLATLSVKLDRITKVFGVYGKFQSALRNLDNGSILYENSNKEFIIGSMSNETTLHYEISIIDATLNVILNDNNFVGFGLFAPKTLRSIFSDARNANYIRIGFDENYVLNKITIIENGCPDVVIEGNKLERYNEKSPLNNSTIIAYLSRIDEMYDEIMAISPPEWTEFLLEYTYPSITINYGENTIFDDEQTLAECIASAASEYGKTISNRLLDSLYNYGDLVADRFNKYMCSEEDVSEPTAKEIWDGEYYAFLKKLKQSILDSEALEITLIVTDLYLRIAYIQATRVNKPDESFINALYDYCLNDYGLCPMLSLLQALIQCIASGFSWEELLKKVVEVGMGNLTPLQMTKFLVLLPTDKQAEVALKVSQVLQENDLTTAFFESYSKGTQGTGEGLTFDFTNTTETQFANDDAYETFLINAKNKAKEDYLTAKQQYDEVADDIEATFALANTPEEALAEVATQVNGASGTSLFEEALTTGTTALQAQEILKTSRSSLTNYRREVGVGSATALGNALGKVQSVIMQAYIDAILEFVDINDIYIALSRFPGVKIIAELIEAANCPNPEEASKVTWLNFLRTLEIEWCRLHVSLTLPPLPTIPNMRAFFSLLWDALTQVAKEIIVSLIAKIIFEILLKLLEILLNSLCDLLGGLASLATTGSGTELLNLLRESFGCPPIESEEQEEAILDAVEQIFSGQGGTGLTTEEIASFLQTASVSLTAFELSDLLQGKLSAAKMGYFKDVVRATQPKIYSLFPNESSLASLFLTVGNLVPKSLLNDLEERAKIAVDQEFPANGSVCGTPDSIAKFKQLREDLLKKKGLSDDEIKHQIDGMQNRADENLKTLVNLAGKGMNNVVGESVMSSLFGSGSLIDPMSVFSATACDASSSIYASLFSTTQNSLTYTQNAGNDLFFDSLKVSYLNDLFKEPSIFEFGDRPVAFLNAVLADRMGVDFVRHNKRRDDIFARTYNSQEQVDDINEGRWINIGTAFTAGNEISSSFFPTTVSKLTQDTLLEFSNQEDLLFTNNTSVYSTDDTENLKRTMFGKKEDFSLVMDTTKGSIPLNTNYTMLYSQFVLNNGVPSSDNLSRLAVVEDIVSDLSIIPKIAVRDPAEDEPDTSAIIISGALSQKYLSIYQSRFDLDDGIREIKEQHLPATLVNSPQADCFISYAQEKVNLGSYSINPSITVDLFNNISDKCVKFIISSLTDSSSYEFGYNYEKEKLVQEDIELDPDTLERKTYNPRVVFLDHEKYGGTEEAPAIYIKPATRTGWLGIADSILPELSCDPNQTENIIGFDSLKSLLSDLQSSIADDDRLMDSPDCREIIPYSKALSSTMASYLQVSILSTMRVYISEAMLRCIPLYNKFVVSYDKIIDELYIDYIINKMENGLLNQGQGILEIKTDEYYLYFLEQCVQIVSRKLAAGEITLTDVEQNAVDIINKMIRDFYFVKSKDKTYLEEVNSILADVKEPTVKLMTISRTSTVSVTEEYYNTLIEVLNTRAQEYTELESFATNLPTLFENYKNSEDSESGMASNATISALVKELKSLLSTIGIIQSTTASKANKMVRKVLTTLNEKIVIGKPTLARIRKEMVLEAIRETKIQAKILMRKILKEEIATMSSNLAAYLYTKPSITNIRKYFLDTDTKIILRNNDLQYFDVAAIPASGNNPLNSLAIAPESSSLGEVIGGFDISSVLNSISSSVPTLVDPITNENGYFILERYIRIQDRELPLSGTVMPQEIINRPEHINGVVNVTAFKDWVSTLSEDTKNTEMFKLFGDYTVSGSSTEGYTLSGSTLGLKYGLRLSFVPPTSIFDPSVVTSSLADVNSEKAYYLQPAYSYEGEEYVNSSYIIPIASGEIDLVDDLLGNFDPDSGLNAYNHDCLVKELYDSNEFRFLFYYCFPLQKYMSATSIFTTETYVRAIGIDDGWENSPEVSFDEKYLNFYKSKEACQILFEIYYNWEDTEYQNTKLSSLLNGKDALMQGLMAWLRPVPGAPLIIAKDRIVNRRPYDDEGNECDVQD